MYFLFFFFQLFIHCFSIYIVKIDTAINLKKINVITCVSVVTNIGHIFYHKCRGFRAFQFVNFVINCENNEKLVEFVMKYFFLGKIKIWSMEECNYLLLSLISDATFGTCSYMFMGIFCLNFLFAFSQWFKWFCIYILFGTWSILHGFSKILNDTVLDNRMRWTRFVRAYLNASCSGLD